MTINDILTGDLEQRLRAAFDKIKAAGFDSSAIAVRLNQGKSKSENSYIFIDIDYRGQNVYNSTSAKGSIEATVDAVIEKAKAIRSKLPEIIAAKRKELEQLEATLTSELL